MRAHPSHLSTSADPGLQQPHAAQGKSHLPKRLAFGHVKMMATLIYNGVRFGLDAATPTVAPCWTSYQSYTHANERKLLWQREYKNPPANKDVKADIRKIRNIVLKRWDRMFPTVSISYATLL